MNLMLKACFLQKIVSFLFIFSCWACEYTLDDSGMPFTSSKTEFPSSFPEIDQAVLEQLRNDTLFQLMVDALDIQENIALSDSLRVTTENAEAYDSLLSLAICAVSNL